MTEVFGLNNQTRPQALAMQGFKHLSLCTKIILIEQICAEIPTSIISNSLKQLGVVI